MRGAAKKGAGDARDRAKQKAQFTASPFYTHLVEAKVPSAAAH